MRFLVLLLIGAMPTPEWATPMLPAPEWAAVVEPLSNPTDPVRIVLMHTGGVDNEQVYYLTRHGVDIVLCDCRRPENLPWVGRFGVTHFPHRVIYRGHEAVEETDQPQTPAQFRAWVARVKAGTRSGDGFVRCRVQDWVGPQDRVWLRKSQVWAGSTCNMYWCVAHGARIVEENRFLVEPEPKKVYKTSGCPTGGCPPGGT